MAEKGKTNPLLELGNASVRNESLTRVYAYLYLFYRL